jgi:hypothetical protein
MIFVMFTRNVSSRGRYSKTRRQAASSFETPPGSDCRQPESSSSYCDTILPINFIVLQMSHFVGVSSRSPSVLAQVRSRSHSRGNIHDTPSFGIQQHNHWMYQDFVLFLAWWWLVVAETCCQDFKIFLIFWLIHVVSLTVIKCYIITTQQGGSY